MSNEISVALQFRVQNPAGSTTGYTQNLQTTRLYNQNSIGANAEIVLVPNTPTAYTFPNVETPGFLYIQNLDTVNSVLYGTLVSGTFRPLGLIKNGEVHFMRLYPGVSFAMQAVMTDPPAPTLTTATTGGTVAAGTYQVITTYVNAAGESLGSSAASITTTGATSTITVASPAAQGNATGWYAYVTQAGGSTFTRQQAAGSPTAIGTNLVLSAPPTNTGANPPTTDNTGVSVNINYLLLED